MKRIHVKISGRVQGVGFRYSLYVLAILHKIKGWVRNLNNEEVEAVFEGEEENLKKILEFCKNGPLLAKVKEIETKEERYKGESEFKVLK
jgi:acylphosphatase